MASGTGRWLKITLGLALIAAGYGYPDYVSLWLIGIGCIPLLTGLADVCLLAPLFGYPLNAEKIRAQYGKVGQPGEV